MSINAIEVELKNSLEILLKPIVHATETKHSKLFVSSLSIVKKFVTYNLIKQNHTGVIIQILKDILDNTNEEFIQIKVLETLLPMVNPQTIHLTETLVNNVLMMCLKIFSYKNAVFKNPISALFKQLMITTYGFLDSFLRPVIDKKIKQRQEFISSKLEDKKRLGIAGIKSPKSQGSDNKKIVLNPEITVKLRESIIIKESQDYIDKKLKEEDINPPENKYVHEKLNQNDNLENQIQNDRCLAEHNQETKYRENNTVQIETIIEGQDDENKINSENLEKNQQMAQSPKSEIKKEKIDFQNYIDINVDSQQQIKQVEQSELEYTEEDLKVKPSDIDLSDFYSFEVYQTSLAVFKSLISIAEGKKKEWIVPTTYSKCLAIELLSGVICQSGNLFKYLPEFLDLIKTDLFKTVKKSFEITNDYIMGLKLSRLSIQIIENLNICYDLINYLLKYAWTQALTWQKLVGLECLASLFQNYYVLLELYQKKNSQIESDKINIYDDIINTLTKVSYAAVTNKNSESNKKKEEKKNETIKHQKLIETSHVLTETDVSLPVVSIAHIFKLLTECYTNFKESLVMILELHGYKLGVAANRQKSNYTSECQIQIEEHSGYAKEMLNYNFEIIKNAMTALLINSNDESTSQTYLNLYQSFINIYGSISLPQARDSYLNDLCKLAIPNNLENSFEMKDKNLLITKALFNIAHCTNILDYSSWLLLLETMQKIYLMLINSNNHLLKPSEEFEIDVIIKNLESNIKKYNPDYDKEEKSVLRNQGDVSERKSIIDEGVANFQNNQQDDIVSARGEKDQQSQMSHREAKENTIHGHEKKKGLFSMFKSAFGMSKHKNGEISSNQNQNGPNGLPSSLGFSNSSINATNSTNSTFNKKLPQLDENVDLQILSNAIDTIFINSLTYEDQTLKDITLALLDSTKSLVDSNNTITENINTYLHFNLTKLLELSVINVRRIHIFWNTIVQIINFLCSKNLTNISRFSLDVLTIIDLFIIVQYKPIKRIDEDILSEENSLQKWTFENWQKTIFSPFGKIASSTSQNISLNIIYNLSKIIQNCGQCLDSSGWSSYIEVCENLIKNSDEILCDNTFKLIEQIVNEYLDYLTPFNVSPLIDILESFSVYKRNHNISYSAITMFWSAAGVCEKFQKISLLETEVLFSTAAYKNLSIYQKEFYQNFKKEQNQIKSGSTFTLVEKSNLYNSSFSHKEFFDSFWTDLFEKLVNISSDLRFDVRKSAINIFADIFVAKNFLISNEVSLNIINKHFILVLDKSYKIFEDKLKMNRSKKNVTMDQNSNQLKTPKFSDNVGDIKIGEFKVDQLKLPERKQKFDEESINKLTQPSADEKEWEDTTILIIQAVGKVIKSFLFLNYQKIKDVEYYNKAFLTNIVNLYSKIVRMTTPEIASSILRSLQEIYYSNVELFLNNFEFIFKVYEEMGTFITTDFFLSQLCTMATSSKMVYNVLEILKEIYLKESNIIKKPDLIGGKNLENLLLYLGNLIRSSKNSEGIQCITNPQRLLNDEKQIFEFIEKLSKVLPSSSWIIYCNYLSSYISIDINDYHSEAHLRKCLELFDIFFSDRRVQEEISFVKEYLPKLISEIKEIACLRNKNEYASVLIKNNKSQMQLWHFATFQLIKILSSILCLNKRAKEEHEREKERYQSNSYNTNNFISNYNTENVLVDLEPKEDKSDLRLNNSIHIDVNNIWEATINCFETIFKQSEGGYKNITRTLLEELLKSCQEMEIQIINFIVNGLLPNSLKIPKEMQIKLLTLLDMGSNFDYNIFNLNTQSSSSSSNISRVCISNLFELCKFRSEESLRKG